MPPFAGTLSPGEIDAVAGSNQARALRGYQAAHDLPVTGEPDPGPMMFIIVGSKAPHLISVVTLDAEFERLGAEQLDAALALYSEQRAKHGDPRDPNVRWDGLPSQLAVLAPPRHAFYGAEGVEYEPEF